MPLPLLARPLAPLRLAGWALVVGILVLAGAADLRAGEGSPAAGTQTGGPDSVGQAPGEALRVYLMTMGPGDEVWEHFGHNAIWIHDGQTGEDVAYNYGMFSFAQDDFIPRLVEGEMLYWVEGRPAWWDAQNYAAANRSVWLQELALTPTQRHELARFLATDTLPENRFYRYDYYRDNCSTRVRDALDLALGGALAARLRGVPTGTTYRSHTQRLTAADLPVWTGLLLALGQPVDQPLSAWEEAFIPMRLMEHVRTATVPGPDGAPVPLVRSEQVLYQAEREPLPEAPPRRVPGFLLAGAVLGGLMAWLGARARRRRGARFGFAVVGSVWGLVGGFFGALIAALWLFTGHVFTYRNENLLQLSPLLLLLPLVLPLLLSGRRRTAGLAVVFLLAGLSALGFLLQGLPGWDQRNGEIIALLLPVHAGLALGAWWASRPLPTHAEGTLARAAPAA